MYKAAKNHFFDHRISENYVPSAFWEKETEKFCKAPSEKPVTEYFIDKNANQ